MSHAFELDTCFPQKICINLARRSDRWAKAQAQFRQHQIEVGRWDALDGATVKVPPHWRYAPGAYGCVHSHLAAVRDAAARSYESILIFEDDVELHPRFRVLFSQFMAQVPANWDALYFGGIHRSDPLFLKANVVRLRKTNSTYAYALRNNIFEAFIELNEQLQQPVDETMKALQSRFHFYCFWPHLAWVARDYSDVLGAEVNHWWLRNSFALDGSKVERQASQTGGLILPSSQPVRFQRAVLELILPPICSVLPEVLVLTSPGDMDALTGVHLPSNCRIICRPEGPIPLDLWSFARGAMELFRSRREYFFACAADTYISNWELQAALHQCLQHDFVTPGEAPVELTAEDTRKALENGAEKVDTRFYPRDLSPAALSGFFVVSERILAAGDSRTGFAVQDAKVFRCPSRPLRFLMQD
jgi:hypothetical protein